MLLEDLRVAPAARPVELGDDDLSVLEEHLEDPVLVGVELDEAAVAAQADGIEGVEHEARCEIRVGRAVRLCVGGHRRMLRAAWLPSARLPRLPRR